MNRAASLALVLVFSGFLGLVLLTPPASASPGTLYMITSHAGCSGAWADTDCWSLSSGGASGAGPPLAVDDIVSDANSGTGGTDSGGIPSGTTIHDWRVTNYPYGSFFFSPGSGGRTFHSHTLAVTAGSFQIGLYDLDTFDFTGSLDGTGGASFTVSSFNTPGAGHLSYTGPNQAGRMSGATINSVTATGKSIYCSPGCTDGGGNTNIFFASCPGTLCDAPPPFPPATDLPYVCSSGGGGASTLTQIRIDTGETISAVPLMDGANPVAGCSNLEFSSDGTLYLIAQSPTSADASPQYLYTVDTTTGAATRVATLALGGVGGGGRMMDLTFNAAGVLYGTARHQCNGAIVDTLEHLCITGKTTGAQTDLGAITGSDQCCGFGLEFSGGALYMFDGDPPNLYTLALPTTVATMVGTLDTMAICGSGNLGPVGAMDVHSSGLLYAVVNCRYGSRPSHLVIINTADASYSNDKVLALNGADAIAFAPAVTPPGGGPAPTPTTPPSGPTFLESTVVVGIILLVAGGALFYLARLLQAPRMRKVALVLLIAGAFALVVVVFLA